jgi:hypothetical protein
VEEEEEERRRTTRTGNEPSRTLPTTNQNQPKNSWAFFRNSFHYRKTTQKRRTSGMDPKMSHTFESCVPRCVGERSDYRLRRKKKKKKNLWKRTKRCCTISKPSINMGALLGVGNTLSFKKTQERRTSGRDPKMPHNHKPCTKMCMGALGLPEGEKKNLRK